MATKTEAQSRYEIEELGIPGPQKRAIQGIFDVGPRKTSGATTYTLGDDDNFSIIAFTSDSAVTVTIPSGLGDNFVCGLIQGGDGTVTASAGTGVTLPTVALATAGIGKLISVVAFGSETYRVLNGT